MLHTEVGECAEHVQCEGRRGDGMILPAIGCPAGDHVAVAEGLDLFQPVGGDELVEAAEEPVQQADDLLGVVRLGEPGEPHEIGEQHAHCVVPIGDGQLASLEPVGDLVGHHAPHQTVDLVALLLECSFDEEDPPSCGVPDPPCDVHEPAARQHPQADVAEIRRICTSDRVHDDGSTGRHREHPQQRPMSDGSHRQCAEGDDEPGNPCEVSGVDAGDDQGEADGCQREAGAEQNVHPGERRPEAPHDHE